MSLLEIKNLKMHYQTDEGDVHAVNDVNLTLDENENLGIVGESGSGKTSLMRAINRVMDDNANIVEGSIIFDGVDLTELSEAELREYRWNEISIIPQSAMNALDPVYTIETQIVEVIQAHEDETSAAEAKERARNLFDLVGLERDRVTDYPHQFSGGMRQRAMIALALALEPKLVLADEPTTALDVVIQQQILDSIKELQSNIDLSMVLVTHDISVVSETCDKIAVFYGGNLVELAEKESVILEPHHPYTMGLRNAFPTIETEDQSLISIPGEPPDLTDPEEKCLFVDRCPFAVEDCFEQRPALEEVESDHHVHCHRAHEADSLRVEASERETWYDNNKLHDQ